MRAAAKYGAVTSLGSLVLSALVVAPAGGATTDSAASHGTADSPAAARAAATYGTAVAAARAAAAGIAFGRCPKAEKLPDSIQCGTVRVPLDYAEPFGRQIELTVSRGRATGGPAEYQGAFVYNPGGPGASSMYFPMAAALPEWEGIARAYDIVGYSPRGVGRSAPLSCVAPADFVKAPTLAPVHPSPRTSRSGSRRRRRTRRAAHRTPDLRCGTTPRSTTPLTWMCCGRRSASGG